MSRSTDAVLQLLDQERVAEAREVVAQTDAPPHWARILAPAVVQPADEATGVGLTDQVDRASRDLAGYAGRWVALREGQVIDSDVSRGELRSRLKDGGQLRGSVFVKIRG